MKQLHVFLVALGVAVLMAASTGGCSHASDPPSPSSTLVYSDAIQEGGPGLVDVYDPPASADSSTIPIGGLDRPAIMVIHGGAWRSGYKLEVSQVAANFASQGYVAFAPNYSLAPAVEWPAPLLDVQSCLRFLRTNHGELGIDPNRIGAWGVSAGGQLSTMLMLQDDPVVVGSRTITPTSGVVPLPEIRLDAVSTGRVTCAVDAFGPADLTIPNGMAPDEDGILTAFLGAPFAQLSRSRLLSASTISYVRDDASVLILHGTIDSWVSIENSEHLNTALLGAQADVHFIPVPGGGHDATTYDAPEAWSATLQFLSQRIGPQSH